jgi:hypothetical protein
MSSNQTRRLTARASELSSRRHEWRRGTRPKAARAVAPPRDRDAFRRQLAAIRHAGLLAVLLLVAVLTHLHVALGLLISGTLIWGVLLLLVDPFLLVEIVADLATAYRRQAGLNQSGMARERRGASATARAIAAAAVHATARVHQARLVAHRLAARLRAALGTVVPTSHPRIAASLVAGSLHTRAA